LSISSKASFRQAVLAVSNKITLVKKIFQSSRYLGASAPLKALWLKV
jgi:hypothetical protein